MHIPIETQNMPVYINHETILAEDIRSMQNKLAVNYIEVEHVTRGMCEISATCVTPSVGAVSETSDGGM